MAQAKVPELLKQGINAKKKGDVATARLLFSRALQLDPENENAWLWLASVAESSVQAEAMLERVLSINPFNLKAQQLYQQLQAKQPSKSKVMIIDHSATVRDLVAITLQRQGFSVIPAADGREALTKIPATMPDLILLELDLPDMDGYQICRTIRNNGQTNHIPVLFLSGNDGFFDRVKGRIAGVTDYITKPFSQRLLIERIRVLLRRQDMQKSEDKHEEKHISYGDMELDDARHLCTWKKQPVNLTVTEYLLVKALVTRPGHVRNRDQLIDMAYGENIYVDDRTVDSHIKRIRRKFKKVDDEFDRIETLYGVGYRYKEE